MGQPYIGECRLVGFNFQVNGWNFCNGALIAISENDTLFNLIGTTYGGDGQQTFALPDLQGRVPVHQGSGYVIGQRSGVETVTLTGNQIPIHSHQPLGATAAGGSNQPQGNLPGSNTTTKMYVSPAAVDSQMNVAMISQVGGSQPHDNMQPYLVMNWIISMFGIYPTPS
jgi:microcystin-dependent protein